MFGAPRARHPSILRRYYLACGRSAYSGGSPQPSHCWREAERLSAAGSKVADFRAFNTTQASAPPSPPAPVARDESRPDATLSTEDVTLISHTHGRGRRAERNISRLELQAAIKHGRKEPAHPSAEGRQRWRYTWQGVVYVTDESSRHEITSWRDDGQDLPVEVHEPGVYGAHLVLIVDASGSMRKTDVDGRASLLKGPCL